MGHAHHFLSRLDRVELPHVELALGLYNDVPLLQYILGSARIPEGAARVAISLDHPEEGPFLVVTREGRFVTCLGAGMSSGDLPVVTRGQLDAIAAKRDDLRSRIADALRMGGPNGGAGRMFKRIREAGDELTREEIAAVIGLQPLYAAELVRTLVGAGTDLLDAREILLRELKHSDRLKPHFREALRTYWRSFWALGHLSVLVGQDGPAMINRLPSDAVDMLDNVSLSWTAVRQGVMSLALKGIWAVARIGKPLLPGYKRRFRASQTLLQTLDSGAGLAALGMRHAKLHGEVSKAIAAGPQGTRIMKKAHDETLQVGLSYASTDTEEIREGSKQALRKIGVETWMNVARQLPPGAPLRFERGEDVPEDLAITVAVNTPYDFLHDLGGLKLTLVAIPWVARATPEQLYLPRDARRAVHKAWEPEDTLDLLRTQRDFYKHTQKRPVGPARKGPCPCGSGKKYKRCCGEEGAVVEGEVGAE